MLNDNMLKPNSEICLKCEYQIQTENHEQRKNVAAVDKKCILWKMDLNFPNPKFNLLSIIVFILIFTEAVAPRCSVKMVFLEISQNSKENTFARVSFLIKLQT